FRPCAARGRRDWVCHREFWELRASDSSATAKTQGPRLTGTGPRYLPLASGGAGPRSVSFCPLGRVTETNKAPGSPVSSGEATTVTLSPGFIEFLVQPPARTR